MTKQNRTKWRGSATRHLHHKLTNNLTKRQEGEREEVANVIREKRGQV